jgi:hypothetical protein
MKLITTGFISLVWSCTCLEGTAIAIPLTRSPQQFAQAKEIATLQHRSGSVEIKRPGEDAYSSANKDRTLYHGDLIRVKTGSQATIRCKQDNSVWKIPDDGVPWGVANFCP